jgi:hypothetical protein
MRRKRQSGPIEAIDNGLFEIRLTADERATLLGLAPPDDPRLRRLFPTAYHDNAEFDAEYQNYMRDELAQSRAASIQTVREVLDVEDPLTERQLYAFMTVLNSLRLVLGTLLDVDEVDDLDLIPEDSPAYGQAQLYEYLGWLLEWTVSALSGE